jgi:transposase InsO family protein
MAGHMRTELVLNALAMALGHRVPACNLLHHSDQGSQYASDVYRKVLRDHGIICSMSRKGNCWDNAVVESFFGTLKTELVYRHPWATQRQARAAIAEYIEVFYNRQRRHSSLGYRSPVEYEDRFDTKAAQTA